MRKLSSLIMALMLTGWVEMSRISRAEVMKVKELEYVQAARTMGAGHFHIIFRDIVVVYHHDISNHGVIFIDPEWLALIPVNISLRQTADRMGNKLFLPRCKLQLKCVNKVIFCDFSEIDHKFPPKNV